MTAYGYIRKSVVHDAARMLSPEMQEDAIRALAARHGDDIRRGTSFLTSTCPVGRAGRGGPAGTSC